MTVGRPSVTVRRRFPFAREEVFDAFRREDALAQWFSPSQKIEVQVLAFQFRPNGGFRFRYRFPDGAESVVRGVYRQIRPPEALSFSWVWEEPDRHAGILTEVSVAFAALGHETEVVVTHGQLPDTAAQDRYAAGWSAQLDRLVVHLSDPAQPQET